MLMSLSRLSGALMLLCSLATWAVAADAGAPQETTVSKAKPTSAVSWSDLNNAKPWELKLTVKAGDPFKAGSASVTSAGIETWKIDQDTEALAAFTGSVPANSAQKQYKPAFNGIFKSDGTQSGKVPTWSVTGTFGVLCTYEKGSTEANGNPSGASGLTAPAVNSTSPANLTFSVKILRQEKPMIIPNRIKDLVDQMPEEAGSCSMDPGAQDYANAASGDAHVDSASTCPRCKQQTLRRVYYLPTVTATDPAITIALPTWANKTDAGPWAQGEWDRFFAAISKHEDNHKTKYVDHCAAAKALIEAFVKSKFIGEVCNTNQGAGETKASELALKQFTDAQAKLDADLAALATKIDADQKKYDADTKHGKTEGCIMNGDIPLLGAKP